MGILKSKLEKDEDCREVEQHIQALRNLLLGQRVVALDTCVLGELEQDKPPAWFNHFQAMSDDGVRFAIPDLCVGERLKCFANANQSYLSTMRGKWKRMVSRLDSIIWKDLPCLPLRGDLFDIVGIGENGVKGCREHPFTVCKSQEHYEYFHDYENSRYKSPEYLVQFDEAIEIVRKDWKDNVLRFRLESRETSKEQLLSAVLVIQARTFSFPEDASQMVELPFRFLIERAYDMSYCNPALGKRTKNDGLDFQMLYLTMAFINVCSTDRFFRMAHDLECVRSCSCHTPGTLLRDWQAGNLPTVKLDSVSGGLAGADASSIGVQDARAFSASGSRNKLSLMKN